jgi:hypothetical protein
VAQDVLESLKAAATHDEPRGEGVPQVVEVQAVELRLDDGDFAGKTASAFSESAVTWRETKMSEEIGSLDAFIMCDRGSACKPKAKSVLPRCTRTSVNLHARASGVA